MEIYRAFSIELSTPVCRLKLLITVFSLARQRRRLIYRLLEAMKGGVLICSAPLRLFVWTLTMQTYYRRLMSDIKKSIVWTHDLRPHWLYHLLTV